MCGTWRQLPELIIAPGHDHTEYGSELADLLSGEVTAERAATFRRLADAIFDEAGRLREPARPHYAADPAGGIGTVAWADR